MSEARGSRGERARVGEAANSGESHWLLPDVAPETCRHALGATSCHLQDAPAMDDDDDASFKPTTSPTTKSCTIVGQGIYGAKALPLGWPARTHGAWAHRDRRRHPE